MENSDGDMPSLPQNNNELSPEEKDKSSMVEEPQKTTKEPAKEKPEANVVRQRKPFFTMGKILAIFGVLLIIGTVVGALIYSQSSDRFEGALITANRDLSTTDDFRLSTTETQDTTTTDMTTDTTTATTSDTDMKTNDSVALTTDTMAIKVNDPVALTTDTTTDSPCDTANHWERTSDDVQICICEEGYVATDPDDPCVKIDYCEITEDELQSYLNSTWVSYPTKQSIEKDINGDLGAYQKENCQSDLIVTQKIPETTLRLPEDETLTCNDPLTKQTDGATGTEYCMCSTNQYPEVTISETLSAASQPIIECKPFICDPTQEQLTQMREDVEYILNGQNLSDSEVTNITAEFSEDYRLWMDANCQTEELTCDELSEALGAAYFAKNWEEYAIVLQLMQKQKCIDSCEVLFYEVVMELEQGNTENARAAIDEYIQKCTDDCTLTYGMMSLYAEKLSEADQAVGAAVAAEDLARLKELVIKYIENCQCFEIEAFLTAPGFPEEDYFNRGTTEVLNRATKLSDGGLLSTDYTIRTAYAQSLSPSVQGVIEDVYNDLCVPDEQDEPEACTSLTIQEPSSTGTYEITEPLDPANDYLKFTVDFDENIEHYRISSQTITLDGDSKSITTAQTEVSLEGGPAAGEEDVIKVVAVDISGALIDACSAEIIIKRIPEDPPPRDDPDPECRSLEIVSPGDAAEPGVPTVELSEGEYTNKVLEINVDADAGSVEDYKYSSANGYITFNGQETLYTADKTVIMEGIVPEGETETISIWARKTETLEGIQACNDGYIIIVPEDEEPPPPEKTPPPVTVTEEEPPPPVKETVVPEAPAPEPQQPVHAAAPKVADTGPGVLIYVFGAGLGGALLRKKYKK